MFEIPHPPGPGTKPADGPSHMTRGGGKTIAYHKTPGKGPGVVFLTGFKSDMTGAKALALETYCKTAGRAFLRFDYTGHGQSSGSFDAGTIGQWAQDALDALDALTEGPQILVGSSMGGWIMLLAARARPERVIGLIGVAAAPDFTRDLMWNGFTDEQRAALERDGHVDVPNCHGDQEPYRIQKKLIDDGFDQILLDTPLEINVPVRLIHGLLDQDVPWRTALKIQSALTSDDVEVTLVKDGGHRLSGPHDLDRLTRTLDALSGKLEAA